MVLSGTKRCSRRGVVNNATREPANHGIVGFAWDYVSAKHRANFQAVSCLPQRSEYLPSNASLSVCLNVCFNQREAAGYGLLTITVVLSLSSACRVEDLEAWKLEPFVLGFHMDTCCRAAGVKPLFAYLHFSPKDEQPL